MRYQSWYDGIWQSDSGGNKYENTLRTLRSGEHLVLIFPLHKLGPRLFVNTWTCTCKGPRASNDFSVDFNTLNETRVSGVCYTSVNLTQLNAM